MSAAETVTSQRVRIHVDDHVAEVVLDRPEKHNALDGAMFTAIAAAAAEVAATPGVRAVVLRGEGPSFCSGIDVGWLAGSMQEGGGDVDLLAREGPRQANLAQRVATDWIDLPVPVIAALHGNVFGGGLQIALGADIRIAAPDTRLSIMEVKWGLVPDMGITQSLPRLVSLDAAKELTFTGRRIPGTEAAELGLVTRVADHPVAAARELASEIASRSPHAVRSGKRLLETAWPAADDDILKFETELQVELIGSPNQLEAIRAGLAREPAAFTDPPPAVS